MIFKLAEQGVDVFRFNFSHCNREEAITRAEYVRAAEKKFKKHFVIMADLMGPKIRIGVTVPEFNKLEDGGTLDIVFGTFEGNAERISLNIPNVLNHLEKGDDVYLGDGDIKLEVTGPIPGGVRTRVVIGGEMRARMGFQARALAEATFALSEKDKTDLQTALEIKADAVAISFVQSEKDIQAVRALIPKGVHHPYLVAKLETATGLKNAEAILKEADVIMIARGDLAFAVPLEELPHIQKDLIMLGLRMGKPIITATHMLESMTHNLFPTRAEVTDVANAVLDGTDAVMTSGETAKGKHPAVVIETMVKIIKAAQSRIVGRTFNDEMFTPEAVTSSASKIADEVGAKVIIVFTQSGRTARLIARHRPKQTILALTPNKTTAHELSFTWGVVPFHIKEVTNPASLMKVAKKFAQNNGTVDLKEGEPFIVCAGMPLGNVGGTNFVFADRA